MEFTNLLPFALLLAGIAVVAFLYSSVGHAGASGYIAVMTLCGIAPATIRPAALILNILVACIGSFQFWRAGHFCWPLFWPFAVLSVPLAYVGGSVPLAAGVLKPLLGFVLLFSAARLFLREGDPDETRRPRRGVALAAGGTIGLLSGLTGTGGGIFLTPLLLFSHWARTKQASATSALFILVNSMAGLAGYASSGQPVPAFVWTLALAATAAGTVGSYLGSRRLPVRTISVLLALVLVIAGLKLVLS